MRIEKFEDIISWQKARLLTIDVYNTFKESKDFGYRNQIERASVSIEISKLLSGLIKTL